MKERKREKSTGVECSQIYSSVWRSLFSEHDATSSDEQTSALWRRGCKAVQGSTVPQGDASSQPHSSSFECEVRIVATAVLIARERS